MPGRIVHISLVPVFLVVSLGYAVWSETNGLMFVGVDAASSASRTSLCEKLPGWCEKQAYSTSDRPRNKIQDKMAETRWRKKKDGGDAGGSLSPTAKSERVKPRIEDKEWFRSSISSRPSRHSEDWKSKLKSELFSEENEDVWESDDEDYIKVEDESEEEEATKEASDEESVEDTEEYEAMSAEDSEEEERDESEEGFDEKEELDSEDEEDEEDEDNVEEEDEDDVDEEEEDESEIAGIFKKRWGFDEDHEDDDSEEVFRKAKEEEDRRRIEEEAKRKKEMLERLKRDAEMKNKAIQDEKRRKINEERKKNLENERRKKQEEEEKREKMEEQMRKEEEKRKKMEEQMRKEEEEKRKKMEEQTRKEEEEKRRKINEERRKRLEEMRERQEEEENRRRRAEEEQQKKEAEERKIKEEQERQRKEAEEQIKKEMEKRQKKEAEERQRKEAEESQKMAEKQRDIEEEHKRRKEEKIRQEKEEAKRKLEAVKRKQEQEAEKQHDEEIRKKEEASKKSERIKREDDKQKQDLMEKRRWEDEKKREDDKEERRKVEESVSKLKGKEKEEERKKEQEEKEKEAKQSSRTQKGEKKNENEKKKDLQENKHKALNEQATKRKEDREVKRKDTTMSSAGDNDQEYKDYSNLRKPKKSGRIPTSEWSPDFPEFFAPTANDEVQNEECKKQSRIYVKHLRRMRTWALQMYDATAKLPSGILSGNVNQLGDFDECLAVDVKLRARGSDNKADSVPAPFQPVEEIGMSVGGLTDFLQKVLSWGAALVNVARGSSGSDVMIIRGRYCLASIDVDVLPDPRRSKADNATLQDAVQRALSYRFLRGSINDTQHFVPRFSTVSWALCVPAVCTARDVEDGLLASIRNWEFGDGSWGSGKVRLQLAIPDEACRVAPQQPTHKRLPPSFYFVIGGLALLVVVTLVATLKDGGEADEDLAPDRRILIAFSLRRSWAVLSAPDDIGSADIHCMHGLRAVCSLALYMAHKVIPAASAPYSNRGKLTQAALSPLSLLLRSSVVYTDTFLLLSGALSSFHFSREMARTGHLAWKDRYVARLFRLTPPLIAVLLYYSFVMEHIGDGPRWGPLVEANARLCRKNMWRNLLYIQNFYPFKEMCAPQTHQLALDVQLSLLSAPLVWLLNSSPLLASPVLLILQAASAWLRHRTALQHRVALLIYHGQKASELYRAADLSYALAPHRATAYMVGIALGYILHVIHKPFKMSKVMVTVGWIASMALAGWAIFGLRGAATKDFKFDAQQVATFNAFAPLAWAVAISWVIMACHVDVGGVIGRILCSRVLLLLSRISYAFYLTQFIVFFHNAGSARSQAEFSIFGVLDLWEFVTVLAVSTIFTLLIDLPVQAVRAALHHKTSTKEENNSGSRVRRSKHTDGNNELMWEKKEE